jgi:hypothetical protein
MEQGIGALWQFQIPRMAQLEMEEQGPAEADAIKHLGEDVHAAMLIRWTVGHNTRTIAAYRLSRRSLRCRGGRPGVMRPHG